jgi:hypothetical protein
LHFFACRVVGANSKPRSPFRWVSRANLKTLNFPGANRALLSMLVEDENSD